ncbi:MAG: hypothetical protein CFH34_00349 [Alphaproteobacteria bacterium MarineAlpha9_Bin4]|nr:MAG: hypothetical protein CFH34_00349 [Alphaproteobacteria bacterium MarineAlpha9_Bin4]
MHYKNIISFIFVLLFLNVPSFANNFVSIKSSTTNLRAGPGKQYPINWTLILQNMPVKIIEKSNTYSKVELYDGTIGWIWNVTISEKKTLLVVRDSYIFDGKKNNIAFVKKNVVLEKLKCDELIKKTKSCKVKIDNLKGYISYKDIWGI